jgi:hypothetical protein
MRSMVKLMRLVFALLAIVGTSVGASSAQPDPCGACGTCADTSSSDSTGPP